MRREFDMEFCRVTEITALAAYKYLGKGDKNLADKAAVEIMRSMLNEVDMDGEIVIGEGEMDEAPMLYIGEKIGIGTEKIDIAVDPIEGTRMVAMGQANALVTILAAENRKLFKAPDMYMEKLVVNSHANGSIDLNLSIEENINNIANSLGKKVSDLTMITLDRERHSHVIKTAQKMGVSIFAMPDGDVAASLLVQHPESDVDFMYTIGGAPEGVVSAGITKALGGDMNARLVLRSDAGGKTEENLAHDETERRRCEQMGAEVGKIYTLDELIKTDNVIFSATGITRGDILEGVSVRDNIATTETIIIRGVSGTIRKVKATHLLDKKLNEVKFDLN